MPVLTGLGAAFGDLIGGGLGGGSLASLLGLSAESVVPAAAGTAGLDVAGGAAAAGAGAGLATDAAAGSTPLGFASDSSLITGPVAGAFDTGGNPLAFTPSDLGGLTATTPAATTGAAATPVAGGVSASAPAAAAGATPDATAWAAGGTDLIGPGGAPSTALNIAPPAANPVTTITTGGTGGVLDNLTKYAPLAGAAAGIGGLGYNILKGNQNASDLSGIKDQITQAETNVQWGHLPPGYSDIVTQWTQSAKAAATQNMATQGMSTDPRQNSALAQQLSSIDAQAAELTAKLGQTYLQEVLSGAGVGLNVSNAFVKLDEMTSQAIANLAGALGRSSGGGTTITVGGQPQTV